MGTLLGTQLGMPKRPLLIPIPTYPHHSHSFPLPPPQQVGTSLGPQLGMPKRPAWRGVASTAHELQDLEEAAFSQYKQVRVGRMLRSTSSVCYASSSCYQSLRALQA